MLPKRTRHDQGRRRVRPDRRRRATARSASIASATPTMIRFGEMTEDELFVTAEAATGRCAHREHERQRSARDPEALRPR